MQGGRRKAEVIIKWVLQLGICTSIHSISHSKFNHLSMSNNDILKKLRVALSLKTEDIITICDLVGFKVTKAELGDIFRNDDHENFKPCGDQILRNFLNGLVIYKRGPREEKK